MAANTEAMTASGTDLAVVNALPATVDAAGYAALTWSAAVGEIVDMGEIKVEYNSVDFATIGNRATRTFKGNYKVSPVVLKLGRAPGDAGQTILKAGLHSDVDRSFKVTYPDGTIEYFKAKIASYSSEIGDGEKVLGSTVSLFVDARSLVEVAPA